MGRKSTKTKLYIYQNSKKVGELHKEATGLVSFQYDSNYLKAPARLCV